MPLDYLLSAAAQIGALVLTGGLIAFCIIAARRMGAE
jgi:hypothetical protein